MKRSRISLLGAPDDRGTGDVGRSVLILAAGVDEEDLVHPEGAAAVGRHVIVRYGRIWAGRRDGVEGEIHQNAGIPPEGFKPLGDGEFVQTTDRCG